MSVATPIINPIPAYTAAAPNLPSSDSESSVTSCTSNISIRPSVGNRKRSASMIIQRDNPNVELRHESYPPDDARAMSPRRSISDTQKLGDETRATVKRQARSLQSGLNALAERIEQVKADHEKLEKQNLALQDYIGGLTRSMSASSTGLTSSGAKMKR